MTAPTLPPDQDLAARRCAACPKMCRSACPTLEVSANERHQPWGHARIFAAALGREAAGFAAPAVVDSAYACATCSGCTPPCHVEGVETPQLVWAVRRAVHEAGGTPAAGIAAVAQAGAGRVTGPSGGWVDPAPVMATLQSLATAGADVLLLPGCGALGRRPRAALAAAAALRALGVAFDVLPAHLCCGMPALTFGDAAALGRMEAELAAAVTRSGARRVVVQSPSCAFLLSGRDGGPVGIPVEPLATVLARAAAAPPRGGAETPVAYHDPCYLARHSGVRAEPRAALERSGHAVVELRRSGDRSRCSGQGGGLPLTHPDLALGYLGLLASDVEEAAGRGVTEVVTGCASCAAALDGAVDGVRVRELAEAVADAVGGAAS